MAKLAPVSLSRNARAALCGTLRLKTQKSAYPEPWSLHCEIALAIFYGLQQKAQGDQFVKPVRYIGVSKLSCLPCYKLMEILKEKEIEFYTRGCHGKTYAKWMYPGCLSSVLSADVSSEIRTRFESKLAGHFAQQRHHGRSLSDSSATSNQTDEFNPVNDTCVARQLTERVEWTKHIKDNAK